MGYLASSFPYYGKYFILWQVSSQSLLPWSAFLLENKNPCGFKNLLCPKIIPIGFLKKLFFYYNWRLVTLQCCDGFCHTLTWISHRWRGGPPVPNPLAPPSPSHPSGLPQCTGFEYPVSCIELGLVIYFTYGNIHVSMTFSQIIQPSPSPRIQNSVLYVCVSFTVLHIGSLLPSS